MPEDIVTATVTIARILRAPEQNVVTNWPLIEAAFSSLGVMSRLARIAALATVHVECPAFKPQSELYDGNPDVYFARYDGRRDLGNTEPGDGARFRGRGFVQITGRANYARYGAELGVDLLAHPESALVPSVAANILARFFIDRKIPAAAEAQEWETVRRLVNGGLNGFSVFLAAVKQLENIF